MRVCHHRLLLLLLFCCLSLHASGSRVNIVNNGYRDIVVAISPDVSPDQADDLLQKIQSLITEASAVLYEATRHRSYIESVNILIPQSWKHVAADASTWENFEDAEIQIDNPNWKFGDSPYTVQLGGCGEPGKLIHLTPNYVMHFDSEFNILKFGPGGKVFVREWARLRYGVFEEHGNTDANSPFPMFFRFESDESSDLVPNVCSDQPVDFTYDFGCKVDETGLYDPDCTYSFSDQFKPGSSIMSDYRMLSSAMHFCDDEESSVHKHNRQAPNKHNVACNTESVWSVISRHTDFAGTNNLPANIANLNPKFNIVRVLNGARCVFVTDVSGSMDDYNRIGRLYDAARRWIQYDIPDETSLGIVKFHTFATVLSNMTIINDETRQQLMDEVPNITEGGTCIGCGLEMATDILSPDGNGGAIVLVTDGMENVLPFIRDVTPQLISAQIQVVSIAFGRYAENEIENLAKETNGKSYFINDYGSNDELNDAFTGSAKICQPAVSSQDFTVVLFQKKYQLGFRTILQDSVIVDSTIGRNIIFRVDYTSKNFLLGFSVMSPSGQVYNTLIFDDATKLAYIEIPGIAEEGVWSFSLTVGSSMTDYVNVIVKSKSRSSSTAPITVECSVPSGTVVLDAAVAPVRLVAVVKQGRNVVLGANVQAYVERPDGVLQVIDLFDSGVGADSEKNDGIYSRYYVDPIVNGRYNLLCVVNGSESSYVDDGNQQSNTPLGDFNRVQSGGTFRVEIPASTVTSYPPSRVTDLKIVAMQVNQTSMTIEWTATGQQLDEGIAKEYQIKYSEVFDNLMDSNFDSKPVQFGEKDVTDGSMQPLESGSKQRVTLVLPKTSENVTYYIALRAVNDNNDMSSTSNVVSVKLAVIKQPPTEPPTVPPTTTTKSTMQTTAIAKISSTQTTTTWSSQTATTMLPTSKSSTETTSTADISSTQTTTTWSSQTATTMLPTSKSSTETTSTADISSTQATTTWSPQTTTKAGSNSVLTGSSDLLTFLLFVLTIPKIHSTVSSWIDRV